MKRVIQRRLQDPLAQLILEGKIADGAKVKVSASKTGLTINGQEFAAAADELTEAVPQGVALN
jgi:ATP-dependent Clp protease ATP-binding subunit ClpB